MSEHRSDRFYRVSRSGHDCTVHLPSCRHALCGVPWNWAEGRSLAEVFRAHWNRPCAICLHPLLEEAGPTAVVRNGRVQFPEAP